MSLQKLNDEQIKMLANILAGIGHGFFAASVIPFIIGLAQPPLAVVFLVLLDSIVCWTLAIIFLGEIKNDNHT